MSRIERTERELFKFDELDDSAKDVARDWYRNASAGDDFFAECVTDEFVAILESFGFRVGIMRGTKSQKAIYWSGFSHQGAGACFDADWNASRVTVTPSACPYDNNLSRLTCEALDLAAKFPNAYGSTVGKDRYMTQSSDFDANLDSDDDNDAADEMASDAFKELCSDLAHWFYRSLEQEYEWQNADEQVDENIRINEYEFTKDGHIA